MTSSLIVAFFLTVALGVSAFDVRFDDETNVLARFYSDFGQIYLRPSTTRADQPGLNNDTSVEYYEFFFTVKEFSQLQEDSLTMLNTRVLERTVTYHPMPNFEVEGARYLYRRDPKQVEPVEIELVDRFSRLFREINQTNRYFFLSSVDELQYLDRMPSLPYYEVIFKCNGSSKGENASPVLSYVDRNYKWTPRYSLDLSTFTAEKRSTMLAYADLRNEGDRTIVVKALELIAGDSILSDKVRTDRGSQFAISAQYDSSSISSLGERGSAIHVYQLALPLNITLTPNAVQSVEFLQVNVTVQSFVSYSSEFSTMNTKGKLRQAYNISSVDAYLPKGRLLVREEGRLLGEVNLPNLGMKENYTATFGFDDEVSYRRYVTIIRGDIDDHSVTYRVRYAFQNFKSTRDVCMDFTESFVSDRYFTVQSISGLNYHGEEPALQLIGTELRGQLMLPHGRNEQTFGYDVTIFKNRPSNTMSKSDE